MDINEFFDEIDEDKITKFVQSGQEEHLTLEFKNVTKADLTDKRDKRTFAKAVSGFANSSGGVIVWGVVAKKIGGIDKACDFDEIEPLSQFVSRLNQLIGELVRPIVEGVRHKEIPVSGDKGFAVTLVPESDAGPHMAMGFEGRHYKRSGDSFYPMEHFDIEDMFGRRKKPKLSLFTVLKGIVHSSTAEWVMFEAQVTVDIKNVGRGIARYIYLALSVNPPWVISEYGLDSDIRMGLTSRRGPTGQFVRYFGNANFVIHPNSILEITEIKRKFREDSSNIEDLVIEAEIRAEEMMVVHEKRVFSGKDIFDNVTRSARSND